MPKIPQYTHYINEGRYAVCGVLCEVSDRQDLPPTCNKCRKVWEGEQKLKELPKLLFEAVVKKLEVNIAWEELSCGDREKNLAGNFGADEKF